ncbi:MAG: hypothetical protein NVS1B6_01770 [Steroidobacteraceae bacterium]
MPGNASADADELTTASTATLRIILMDASAELAQEMSGGSDWALNYVRVAHWIARQAPLLRELASKNRHLSMQEDTDAPSALEIASVLRLIDGFMTDLAARAPQAVRDHERRASIEKAKQEWECTADALTAVVCLLNADGLILRANRVIEQWRLGSVSDVIGKKAHAVLHPGCVHENCRVADWLQNALRKLHGGEPQEFEFYSPAGDQTLQFTLRPMFTGDGGTEELRDGRSVLVVTDVSALRRAQTALENVNFNLESRVRMRTRELNESNRVLRKEVERREQAELELRASRNNLALLSEQLIQAQEVERRRIALELHDSVGQSLSAIKYTVERAIIMVQRPNLGSPESVLSLAVQRIHETVDNIRAISMNLRPQMLDNLGAASATSWFCRNFAEIYSTMTVHAEISAQNDEIPKRISTHLFRCVQELLNNAAKHANAKTVWVALKRDGSQLSLEVRDDGIGICEKTESPDRSTGFGIRNLRERAEMTDGQFSLSSLPGAGTSVQIVWPVGPGEAMDGDGH